MDLSLPPTAPEVFQYRYRPVTISFHPIPLYVFVNLPSTELLYICEICNAKLDIDEEYRIVLPERYLFNDGILRSALDYHVNVSCKGNYSSRTFVAVTTPNWKNEGLLVVGLDTNIGTVEGYETEDLECVVDTFFAEAEDVAIGLGGLQTLSWTWWEMKHDMDLARTTAVLRRRRATADAIFSDGARMERPDMFDFPPPGISHTATEGFYIAVYVVTGLAQENVINCMEPLKNRKLPEDFIFRFESYLPSEGILEAACKLHPQKCTANYFLHKTMFVIVDTTQVKKNGVQIVHLDWESCIDPVAAVDINSIGKEAPRKLQRSEFNGARIFRLIKAIARGERAWEDNNWCFQIFITGDLNWNTVVPLIEVQRGHHEARIVVGGVDLAYGMPNPTEEKRLAVVAKEIPRACYRKRFRKNYHRHLFVQCDSNYPETEGVILIWANWDSEVEAKSEAELETLDISSDLSRCRCPIRDAYKVLEEIANSRMSQPSGQGFADTEG